jgi:hypothetical protein
VTFVLGQQVAWPVPPDWKRPVRETLAWRTDILRAATGVTQHRALRLVPRRSFAFEVVAEGQERRVADALVADRGGRGDWALPIWPDVQHLAAALPAESATVPCITAHRDFVAGGRAMLWRSLRQWELVQVEGVLPGGLELATPTQQAWPAGTRLYPVRTARLVDNAEESLWTDLAGRRGLTFAVEEPCDWPPQPPAATYLGHPVLQHASDATEDGRASWSRQMAEADNDTAPPFVADVAGRVFATVDHRWRLWGPAERAAFRGLLYALRGRQTPVWVPSGLQDLRATAPITAASTALAVEWAGYTLYGRQQPHCRDLRIVLHDGTAFMRRVTDSAVAGDGEVLQLDAPLGQLVQPGAIRRIEWMRLCTLASDQIEIEHHHDLAGMARALTPFTAVLPDV